MSNKKTALLVPSIPHYLNHPVHPQYSQMLHHLREIYITKGLTRFGEAVNECSSDSDVAVVWIDGVSPISDNQELNAGGLARKLRMQKYGGLIMLARQDDGANGLVEVMLDSLVLIQKDRTHTWVYDPAVLSSPKTELLIPQLVHYATSSGYVMD